jgi:hypothetical protein
MPAVGADPERAGRGDPIRGRAVGELGRLRLGLVSGGSPNAAVRDAARRSHDLGQRAAVLVAGENDHGERRGDVYVTPVRADVHRSKPGRQARCFRAAQLGARQRRLQAPDFRERSRPRVVRQDRDLVARRRVEVPTVRAEGDGMRRPDPSRGAAAQEAVSTGVGHAAGRAGGLDQPAGTPVTREDREARGRRAGGG